MKSLCRITFLSLVIGINFPIFVLGQTGNSIYTLKEKLKNFEQQQDYVHDTAYANTLIDLAYIYSSSYPDSALLVLQGNAEHSHESGYNEGEVYTYIILGDSYQTKGVYEKALENYEKAFRFAKKFNYKKVFPRILNNIGIIHLNEGNYPEALSKFYESLKDAEAIDNKDLIGATLNNIAIVHFYQGKFEEAESTYRQRLKIAQEMSDTSSISLAYTSIGDINLQQKDPVKALHNLTIAYNLALKVNDREMLLTATLSTAEAYYMLDSLQKSVSLFENALLLSRQMSHGTFICNALIGLAKVHKKQGMLKEALTNGLEGLQRAEKMGQTQLMRDANEIVSSIYEALGDGNNALKYYRTYKIYSDSMNNLASQRAIAIEKASYEFSKKEIAFQRKALQQRLITFSALAALILVGVILFIVNRHKKRLGQTNKKLYHKNIEVEAQRLTAEEALSKLRATQTQLIQSEKMASFGELTAGIAHEIQNPLNFVNNFSEVNVELIQELKNEKLKVKNERDEQLEIDILNDIAKNEEKINYHGKRADAIVRGMLQHSRTSTGKKELTDINSICIEYLRLSYHGLRAKDKNFNADHKTDFDETIGKINTVPQNIGRVLLNLYNNAFYAVNEKVKTADKNYKPLVFVQTKKLDKSIEIRVEDNGNGISSNIIGKIFQPFFTTKPTGQGTGLGLSLAYDIITKEHGGTIKAESEEGKGSMFIINLPVV